jgi:hypothetical protein
MDRTCSSDAPDQRPTEIAFVGPFRIVIGQPVREIGDETALRELVSVLARASEEPRDRAARGRRWLAISIAFGLFALPVDLLQFVIVEAREAVAALLAWFV